MLLKRNSATFLYAIKSYHLSQRKNFFKKVCMKVFFEPFSPCWIYVCCYFQSLSSLVKSTENGNGVTFRSGADVTMDINVSGFGPETAIDRAMQMVMLVLQKSCPPSTGRGYFWMEEGRTRVDWALEGVGSAEVSWFYTSTFQKAP